MTVRLRPLCRRSSQETDLISIDDRGRRLLDACSGPFPRRAWPGQRARAPRDAGAGPAAHLYVFSHDPASRKRSAHRATRLARRGRFRAGAPHVRWLRGRRDGAEVPPCPRCRDRPGPAPARDLADAWLSRRDSADAWPQRRPRRAGALGPLAAPRRPPHSPSGPPARKRRPQRASLRSRRQSTGSAPTGCSRSAMEPIGGQASGVNVPHPSFVSGARYLRSARHPSRVRRGRQCFPDRALPRGPPRPRRNSRRCRAREGSGRRLCAAWRSTHVCAPR